MIYLDNSASSFYKPKEVFDAVNDALKAPCNPSRSSYKCALNAGMAIFNARNAFALEFNCNSDNVIFTSGCTEALNTAIFGLNLRGHVITTVYEHNSVLRPLHELKRRGLISLSIVSNPAQAQRALRADTRLIAINHVSNVTGTEADLGSYAEIAQKNSALLLVDAAQSAGYKRIDMKKQRIDMLAVAGHKGLHGIQGAGALLLSDNPSLRLRPVKFGGTGAFSSLPEQPDNIPEGFEAGTPPTPAIAAMAAGLSWSLKHQKENAEKLLQLSAELTERLKQLGIKVYSRPNECGIVAYELDNMPSLEAGNIYDSFNIAVRCGFHCAPLVHEYLNTKDGLIRVSFGVESKATDITALINATKTML